MLFAVYTTFYWCEIIGAVKRKGLKKPTRQLNFMTLKNTFLIKSKVTRNFSCEYRSNLERGRSRKFDSILSVFHA